MEAYLGQLPDGASSYPNHRQVGTVYLTFLEGIDLAPHLHLFPRRLADLLRRPPAPTDWIGEVEATAIYLSMVDLCLAGDEDRLVAHAYACNRRLLDEPIYRVLFRLAGTERSARRIAARWSAFHQGISLSAAAVAAQDFLIRLDYPTGLVPPVIGRCYATVFQAGLELSGAREVESRVLEHSPVQLTIRTTWR